MSKSVDEIKELMYDCDSDFINTVHSQFPSFEEFKSICQKHKNDKESWKKGFLKTLELEVYWNSYASHPMDLTLENLTNHDYFVYDRRLGLFSVDECNHEAFMSLLYSWEKDNEGIHFLADGTHYLQRDGTFYRSSCNRGITVGMKSHLNFQEKTLMKRMGYPILELF